MVERAKAILELLEKSAEAPREAIAALPRRIVRRKNAKVDREDEMIQLKLL